jgi:hypothetical protein
MRAEAEQGLETRRCIRGVSREQGALSLIPGRPACTAIYGSEQVRCGGGRRERSSCSCSSPSPTGGTWTERINNDAGVLLLSTSERVLSASSSPPHLLLLSFKLHCLVAARLAASLLHFLLLCLLKREREKASRVVCQ